MIAASAPASVIVRAFLFFERRQLRRTVRPSTSTSVHRRLAISPLRNAVKYAQRVKSLRSDGSCLITDSISAREKNPSRVLSSGNFLIGGTGSRCFWRNRRMAWARSYVSRFIVAGRAPALPDKPAAVADRVPPELTAGLSVQAFVAPRALGPAVR